MWDTCPIYSIFLNACFPDIVLTAMTVHLRYYLENNYNNIIVQSMVQIKVVLC